MEDRTSANYLWILIKLFYVFWFERVHEAVRVTGYRIHSFTGFKVGMFDILVFCSCAVWRLITSSSYFQPASLKCHIYSSCDAVSAILKFTCVKTQLWCSIAAQVVAEHSGPLVSIKSRMYFRRVCFFKSRRSIIWFEVSQHSFFCFFFFLFLSKSRNRTREYRD